MLTLYELVDMLPERFSPHFIPRLNQLYAFITKNKHLTSLEASELFFGQPNRVKYFNILKNDLKKALAIYLICYPSWSLENKNKVLIEECHKLYTSYKIFLLNNKRSIAIEMAKSLVPHLQKLELHTLLYSVADDLMLHYSIIEHNAKRRKKYEQLVTQELQNILDYAVVRKVYTKLFAVCNNRESYPPSIIALAKESMQQVRPYLRDGRHNINRYIYIIQLCRYTVVHEYKKILEVCNTALSSFPSNHPNIRSLSFVFLFNKITACIPLERLEEAKRIARETIQIVPKGNFNWHLVFLRRITACFHGGEYQEAYQLYKEYEKYQKARKRMKIKNGKQAATYPIITEHWEINRGYLYFLNKVGLVHEYEKERFYLGKFLNEVPVYSKDKAGNNINILLIQILVQLFRGQYGKIIDRIKSLNEYVRLYTRNEETKRANIFIKMIIKMESARFHRKGTELKTKKLLEQLKNTPLRMGQNLAIEIVPYEVLWSEILDIIDNKFRISASKASQ